MTIDWIGIVKEIFPGITDNTAGYLLWNSTAFPFNEDVNAIREQLQKTKEAHKLGKIVCDCCGEISEKVNKINLCKKCEKDLCA